MKKLQYLQTLLKHELEHFKQLSQIEEERQDFEQFEKNTKKDPFCIFKYDATKLESMLQQVYPEKYEEKTRLLYGAKYIYDGSRKYENVLMPQVEETKKVLQTIIDDICTFSHVFYKKVEQEGKELEKNYQAILTTVKENGYLNQTDSLEYFLKKSELPIENQLQILYEVQDYNTSIFKILFEQKQAEAMKQETKKEIEVLEPLEIEPEIEIIEENIYKEPSYIEPFEENSYEESNYIEQFEENDKEPEEKYEPKQKNNAKKVEFYEEEPEHEIFSSKNDEYFEKQINTEIKKPKETRTTRTKVVESSPYIEDYIKILETMDPYEEYALYQVLPAYSMPNFEELMEELIAYEESMMDENEDAAQFIRVMKKYINKKDSNRMIDAKRSLKQKKSVQR